MCFLCTIIMGRSKVYYTFILDVALESMQHFALRACFTLVNPLEADKPLHKKGFFISLQRFGHALSQYLVPPFVALSLIAQIPSDSLA